MQRGPDGRCEDEEHKGYSRGYVLIFMQKKGKTHKKYGIMNARHKRKGKALPKPGRSLTAAIAARCATKTWYNERSPRRAGVTGLVGAANAGVYKERKTHPQNGSRSDGPRWAGTTMVICAGRQSCWHKKTETVRELSSSSGGQDPAGKNRGCGRISERAEASRKGMEDSPACEEPGGRVPENRDGKEHQPGDSR